MPTVSQLLTRFLVDLASRAGFVWEKVTARYRDKATGRFVSEQVLVNLAESFTGLTQDTLTNITERMTTGKMPFADWQRQFVQELKDAYIVNAQIGRGGRNAMTQADYGRIGQRLRSEYKYFNAFSKEIANGDLSAAQIQARVDQYAAGTRKAYYDGRTAAAKDGGFTEERRVLNPAEHCTTQGDRTGCIEYAAKGWQPIGTMPEPGEGTPCRGNCKCAKEYR